MLLEEKVIKFEANFKIQKVYTHMKKKQNSFKL